MKNNISRQLLFNYLIIVVVVIVFIVSVFYINEQYQAQQSYNYSIDFYQFEVDYIHHGFDYALKQQNLSPKDHLLILDSENMVVDQVNMPKYPVGSTMSQKLLMEFISSDFYSSYYYLQGVESDYYFIVGFFGEVQYLDIIQLLTVVFGILFLIIVVFYANITSRKIVAPIKRLVHGVTCIADGEYGRQIFFESNNELSTLKDAVNTMSSTLKEQHEEQEEHQRAKQQFIINISHDIRTPLTNIIGYSEQLLSFAEENIKWKPSVEIINKYGHQANDLVNNLFELSRMEVETFSFELSPTDVTELLRRSFIHYIQEFEDYNIEYDIDLPEKPIMCNINQLQFERVINNLIGNSIKYNERNFSISINVKEVMNQVEIRLRDTGIGIPKEYCSSIFQPLVRVENSRNRMTGGSGLGLSIAKEIIDKHHGSISINPDYVNGVEFIILLPTA